MLTVHRNDAQINGLIVLGLSNKTGPAMSSGLALGKVATFVRADMQVLRSKRVNVQGI